jgi:uncharacterized protein YcaQ
VALTKTAPTMTSRSSSQPAPIELTKDEARYLAVIAQRLDRRPPARQPRDRALLLDTIRTIGCLQLDSISVISRTHETVMWSRVGPYDVAELNALHYPDGALFEYLVHAAALAPIEFFPYFRRKMAYYRGEGRDSQGWQHQNRDVLNRVLAVAREKGSVSSRDFDRPEGRVLAPWEWYGGKPERQALDALWANGELMVLKREGFQRTYAPTEQITPGAHDGPLPSIEEQRRWFVTRAVAALGVATPAWVKDYFRTGGMAYVPNREVAAELQALGAEGKVIPASVPGLRGPIWIGNKEIDILAELRAGRRRPTLTTLLSPFDNLTWHRGRTAELFEFAYRIECYTPAQKRKYGYYSLPILHRGRLVGRLDPSYDRRARVLTIRSLHLEPSIRPTEPLAAAVAGTLHDLLTFLKGQDIGILVSDPPEFAPMVQQAIEMHGFSSNGVGPT